MENIGSPEQGYKLGNMDFYIKIIFRQNASWQGEVHWLEADQKRYFRSALELLMLIQAALQEAGVPEADDPLRTWAEQKSKKVGERIS